MILNGRESVGLYEEEKKMAVAVLAGTTAAADAIECSGYEDVSRSCYFWYEISCF